MKSKRDINKLFQDYKNLEVQPSAKTWRKLERKLDQHRRRGRGGIQRLMAMAAALLALIVFVLLLTMVANKDQSILFVANETSPLQLEELKLSPSDMALNAYRVVSFSHSHQDRMAAPISEGSADRKLVATSKKGEKSSSATIPTEQPIAKLSDFRWLIGAWQDEAKGKKSLEYWQELNDQNLHGLGIVIHKRDTIFRETILLEDNGEELVLWIQLEEKGRSYPFALSSYNNGEAVFINPNRDFPKRILLAKNGEDAFSFIYLGKEQNKPSDDLTAFLKRRNILSDRQIKRELKR